MAAFDKYFSDTYDLVDLIKNTAKSFVALVYDKNAKRLCTMKQRNLRSLNLYKILKDSSNPHIPQIYRLFERDGKLIVIEEHIDGQSLEELLTYQMPVFSEKLALNILLQLCDCLAILHKDNIINRDIKPSNIMLTKDNQVKLIDFSIARIFKPDSVNDTEFLGTRGYAAPEQFGLFDVGQSDPRADIYALGVTIKELLGKDYHGWLSGILNRCTDLSPDRRYQSVTYLTQSIKRTRKLHLFKRFTLVAVMTSALFALPQLITFNSSEEPSNNDSALEDVVIAEQTNLNEGTTNINSETAIQPSSSILNDNIANQLINFTNNPQNLNPTPKSTDNSNVQIPPSIETPTPQTSSTPQQNSNKTSKRPKLLLYINGKLSENWSEHSTAGYIYISDTDGYQNWQQNNRGSFLFPANWSALLRIQNHTNSDIINSHLNVSLGGNDEFSIEIPTIKAGQSFDVDIPIANKVALYVLGSDNIHGKINIFLRSSNDEYIAGLQREIEIKK
ncbi:MAG: serine/threonine protein kinase [Selenomonadaceae bacterium]|nr:serine/threonine protein kinase [Selenomonadaceae bacterium]